MTPFPDSGLIPMLPDSPRDLGYPHPAWRPGQREVIERIHTSTKPVIFLSAPTGTGKSLIASALADLEARDGGRTLIATRTIQLQDQYLRDFPDRMARMVGRPNFPCPIGYDTAAVAPCTSGVPCVHKGKDSCPYYKQRNIAAATKTLVVNYDYLAAAWPGRFLPGSPLADRTLLIGDEAHLADDALRSTQAVEITRWHERTTEQHNLPAFPEGRDLGMWALWADDVRETLSWVGKQLREWERHDEASRDGSDYRQLRPLISLYRSAGDLLGLLAGGQVVVAKPLFPAGLRVEPAFADRGFRELQKGLDKIVLMSATLPGPELTAALLGISPEDYEVVDLPSTFDPQRRPLIYDPVVRVKKGMSDDDIDNLVGRIDYWLDRWPEYRGIIHCHAYWLGDAILRKTRNGHRLISHAARGLPDALATLARHDAAGMWLLSPVAHSGVDLPGDLLRGQIICKLPTPDLGDQVVAARKEALPETYDQAVAATLIQSYGRAMRAEDDWGLTVLLDANFSWWQKRNGHLLPPWVQEAIVRL